MFTVKTTWCLVTFIFHVLVVRADVRSEGCDYRYIVPEWMSPSSTSPPCSLNWTHVPLHNEAIVEVKEIQDNVTLSLFALPFAKSEADCLSPETIFPKLAESREKYELIVGENESEKRSFHRIFTGCYYFELTNSTNHKWISDGFFLNSTIQYNDTKLGCKDSFESAQAVQSMQLSYELSIGQTCLMLRCRLWELAIEDDYTLDDLDNGRITPSQECDITYIENEMLPGVECLEKSGQHLTLSPGPVTVDGRGRWTSDVTWTNLREGGAYYYAQLLQFNNTCNMTMTDLTAWRPAVQVGGIIHGYRNETNTPLSTDTNDRAQPEAILVP